ncbi:MAG: Flp family type IVb pilin [Acidobacteriaceae bacterium]
MKPDASNVAVSTRNPLLKRLRYEESGADMIEYALIGTLIALAAIASIAGVGSKIAGYYSSIASSL